MSRAQSHYHHNSNSSSCSVFNLLGDRHQILGTGIHITRVLRVIYVISYYLTFHIRNIFGDWILHGNSLRDRYMLIQLWWFLSYDSKMTHIPPTQDPKWDRKMLWRCLNKVNYKNLTRYDDQFLE